MLLKIIRKKPQGNAICGELLIDNRWFCSTLGRTDVAIPAGFYPVTLTMSPRFGEVLPLIGNVVGRTGIRIHAGNYPRDTAGCILAGVANTGGADASSADSTRGDTVYLDHWRDRWRDRVVIRTDTVYQNKETVVQLPHERYVPRTVRWLAWIGALALFALLLRLLWRQKS